MSTDASSQKTVQSPTTKDDSAKKRLRSPNYPALGLADAVTKSRILWQKEAQGKHSIPLKAICSDWEYSSETNGSFQTAVGAVKQYGLLESAGPGRELKMTELAKKLIVYPEGSAEHIEGLKEAAIRPVVFKKLWDRYGWPVPSFETVRTYLLQDGYSDDVLPGLFTRYKGAIELSRLNLSDKNNSSAVATADIMQEEKTIPVVGDLVQWTSNGAMQFRTPLPVVSISEDGQWIFVQGIQTGLPIEEITVQAKAVLERQKMPPTMINPSGQRIPPIAPPASGIRQDTFNVDEGTVILQYPASLSQSSFEDLKAWFELQVRKISRSVTKPKATES